VSRHEIAVFIEKAAAYFVTNIIKPRKNLGCIE